MLFKKVYGFTYYAILGLVIGSIATIFPGIELTFEYFLNFLFLIGCFMLSYSLSRYVGRN